MGVPSDLDDIVGTNKLTKTLPTVNSNSAMPEALELAARA
jgi:hypothetical protein